MVGVFSTGWKSRCEVRGVPNGVHVCCPALCIYEFTAWGTRHPVSRTRRSALRVAPQSRDLAANTVTAGRRISSAPRRKRGALRSIRGTSRACAKPSLADLPRIPYALRKTTIIEAGSDM